MPEVEAIHKTISLQHEDDLPTFSFELYLLLRRTGPRFEAIHHAVALHHHDYFTTLALEEILLLCMRFPYTHDLHCAPIGQECHHTSLEAEVDGHSFGPTVHALDDASF